MNDSVLAFPSDPEALFRLATRRYHAKEHRKCLDILSRIVEIDPENGTAHCMMGQILAMGGEGVAQDFPRALLHAERSIEVAGYPEGYVLAAGLYLHGLGTSRCAEKARQYYEFAFEEFNHPLAALYLGRFHEFAWTGPQDLDKALMYYTAADQLAVPGAWWHVSEIFRKQGHRWRSFAYALFCNLHDRILGKHDPCGVQWIKIPPRGRRSDLR